MKIQKIRTIFGVMMPDGKYNNAKTVTYSVPTDVHMSDNDEYANRWKELVELDMKSYCRVTGAVPVAIMAPGFFHKDYQRDIVY